jgi:osmotically-inducible protein OsmY
VPGVRFCQNQLTSHGPRTRTPAVIARDIQSRLDWDPLLEHAPIRVSVRASRVFLAGRVGSPLERRQAVVASRVRGVSAVDARALVVDATHRPDPNLRVSFPSDAEISTTIQDLASHWPAAATNVSTTVVAGVVTFNGTVPNLTDSRALEARARSAVGVRDVQNRLSGPWSKQPDPPARRFVPGRAPRRR